jgi:F0F1-type ATP synthase membrane subunit b/b'
MDNSFNLNEFVAGATGLIVVWVTVGNLIFKPVLKLLDKREHATSGAETRAEELKIKAATVRTEVEQELRAARQAASKQREDIVSVARIEAQTKVDTAQKENHDLMMKKLAEIEAARKVAESSLESEAEHLANLISSRVLSDKGSSYIQ